MRQWFFLFQVPSTHPPSREATADKVPSTILPTWRLCDGATQPKGKVKSWLNAEVAKDAEEIRSRENSNSSRCGAKWNTRYTKFHKVKTEARVLCFRLNIES